MHVQVLRDVEAFLRLARPHLEAEPVVSTVVAGVAARALRAAARGETPPPEDWWAVVREHDGTEAPVVGLAMRTARSSDRPAYLLPMPDDAARALARALHEAGEHLPAANGALPAARVVLEETVRLDGGRVEVREHTRLHEVREVRCPDGVPGRLRLAGEIDVPLCAAWFAAFGPEADAQAGRAPGTGGSEPPAPGVLEDRVADERVWLWEHDDVPVSLVASRLPAGGTSMLGPVYTPPGQRGRGWAGAAVAAVSVLLLERGERVCLFTDQANPVSNRLYHRLGFRPVVDQANLVRTGHLLPSPP